MKIPVLVEPMQGTGFRARSAEPFAFVGEGATTEEALQKLELKIKEQMARGVKLMSLEISAAENPWTTFSGMFQDDPLFADVIEIMKEQRRLDDENTDAP